MSFVGLAACTRGNTRPVGTSRCETTWVCDQLAKKDTERRWNGGSVPSRIQSPTEICPMSHQWWILRDILWTVHTTVFPALSLFSCFKKGRIQDFNTLVSLPLGATSLYIPGSDINEGMDRKKPIMFAAKVILLLHLWRKQIRSKGCGMMEICPEGKIRPLKINMDNNSLDMNGQGDKMTHRSSKMNVILISNLRIHGRKHNLMTISVFHVKYNLIFIYQVRQRHQMQEWYQGLWIKEN